MYNQLPATNGLPYAKLQRQPEHIPWCAHAGISDMSRGGMITGAYLYILSEKVCLRVDRHLFTLGVGVSGKDSDHGTIDPKTHVCVAGVLEAHNPRDLQCHASSFQVLF